MNSSKRSISTDKEIRAKAERPPLNGAAFLNIKNVLGKKKRRSILSENSVIKRGSLYEPYGEGAHQQAGTV